MIRWPRRVHPAGAVCFPPHPASASLLSASRQHHSFVLPCLKKRTVAVRVDVDPRVVVVGLGFLSRRLSLRSVFSARFGQPSFAFAAASQHIPSWGTSAGVGRRSSQWLDTDYLVRPFRTRVADPISLTLGSRPSPSGTSIWLRGRRRVPQRNPPMQQRKTLVGSPEDLSCRSSMGLELFVDYPLNAAIRRRSLAAWAGPPVQYGN